MKLLFRRKFFGELSLTKAGIGLKGVLKMWTIYNRRDVMSEAERFTRCSGIHRSEPDRKRTYWAAVFTGTAPFYWWRAPGGSFRFPFRRGSDAGDRSRVRRTDYGHDEASQEKGRGLSSDTRVRTGPPPLRQNHDSIVDDTGSVYPGL